MEGHSHLLVYHLLACRLYDIIRLFAVMKRLSLVGVIIHTINKRIVSLKQPVFSYLLKYSGRCKFRSLVQGFHFLWRFQPVCNSSSSMKLLKNSFYREATPQSEGKKAL